MTVGQLIAELHKYPSTHLVVLAKDAEGNGYSPLEDVGDGMYAADSTWSGEVRLKELTTEDGDVPCVVLGPVN